ncbi:MAG TPA: hypothetical protein VM121_00630, partial [Acidimicrobiales bacterium]|nr:hypothetical protein [Acidimicrobiales bacterium]
TLTMAVPADFPTGYAELVGTSSDGTSAMTWVLVGERNPATPAAPPGTVPWYADPSVVVLGALTFGALGAAAYVLLRRKNRPTILPKGR